jgi:hypothetical protein
MRTRLLLVPAALALTGCGTVAGIGADPGPQQREERTIEDVAEVELATSGELVLRPGDAPALEVVAGENVLEHLTSDVRDGRLVLGDDGSLHDSGDVRFEVVLPAVDTVELSGSGSVDVRAPSALRDVVLSGSGEIGVAGLDTDELRVELSGSGRLDIEGDATRQDVSIDGSGTYDGGGLRSEDATVTVSGSGTADVSASSTLEAVIEGSGTITYSGDPAVHSRIDGSGTVAPG